MMKPEELIRLEVTDLTAEGRGVAHEGAMAVFVDGALPGDTVLARVSGIKRNYALARTEKIVEPSKDRRRPFCPHMGDCGGCPFGGLSYSAQLGLKERRVREMLARLGGVKEPALRSIIRAESEFGYRNKAVMATGTDKSGSPLVGFRAAGSRRIINCAECRLQAEPAMLAAEALREFMRSARISTFDEESGRGLLRHMVVRTAPGTGEVMVILVVNGSGIPESERLADMLDAAVTGGPWSLESVVLNINRGPAGRLYGRKCRTLAGKSTIAERIGAMQYEISPLSFYQVNPAQTVSLYDTVAGYAGLCGGERVIDVYCGAGTIGLWLIDRLRERDPGAAAAVRLTGIESEGSAILDANRNAVLNGVVNAVYEEGRAEELLGAGQRQADVLIFDPPRRGLAPELLKAAADTGASRIVYVSCDPATLARDIRLLGAFDYELREATPIDLFPNTGAVETVARLSRGELQ